MAKKPLMQEHITRRIYNIQSHFYDSIASRGIRRRQRSAIDRMDIQSGQWVLDLGIGTGLSLKLYPSHCNVVGIDLSEGMLSRARQRIRTDRTDNAHLVLGDAMFMPFARDAFDMILVSHVITVVSDPMRLLEHICRIGKPGCQIVIINHFQSGYRPLAWLEDLLSPLFAKLGWRSDINLHELLQQANMDLDFRYKLTNFDFWEIVFLKNQKPRIVRYDRLLTNAPAVSASRPTGSAASVPVR